VNLRVVLTVLDFGEAVAFYRDAPLASTLGVAFPWSRFDEEDESPFVGLLQVEAA
jgi:hypothetical protein